MSNTEVDTDFASYAASHRAALLRFAVVLTGDFHLAEDIVADVLGLAFEKWDTVGSADLPHAYVRRMVVNHYLSWRRKWSRIRPEADPVFYDRAVADGNTDYAERDAVLTRLTTLSPKQRAAIVLHFYEDLTHRDIARVMNCREGTVRSHLSRGLSVLRIQYDAEAAAAPNRGNHHG